MDRSRIIIEPEELQNKLGEDNLRIFNANIEFFRSESDPTAYEKYLQGHIPGAAFFDHQDFSDPDSKYEYMLIPEADLAAQIGKIGISEDSEVIFYAFGMLPAATRAWWILRYAGHNNVRILNSGLDGWEQTGGKLEQEARQYEPSKFEIHPRPEMFASKEEVLAAMIADGVTTEYALSTEMYEGAFIPGSTHLPCMQLMQGMESLLSDGEIIPHFEDASHHERIITYCGGGIAATVNAVAHLIAGNQNVSVYDGSLFEWMGEGLPTTRARDNK